MVTPEGIVEAYARNTRIVRRQCEGLSNADSLIQPPFSHNCLNWVLGHMVASRDEVLTLLGAEPALGAPGERYRRESAPVTGGEADILSLEELLAALDRTQAALAAAVPASDTARQVTVGTRSMSAGEALFFFYFHDTYHAGQTDLLRQLAGKNDKIL